MLEEEYKSACDGNMSWDIHEHLPTLRRYASLCHHVTEMGVEKGGSTRAFLMARPETLISIDISPMSQEVKKLIPMVQDTNWEYKQVDNLTITIDETDLLFIDTFHTYGQLIRELSLHGNKARKYIILHDTSTWGYFSHQGDRGLIQAINEFLNDNHEWAIKEMFDNNNGLVILGRKSLINRYALEDQCGFSIKHRLTPADINVGWEVFYSGTYDIDKFFTLPEKPLIVDIGAHIGLFSLKAMGIYKSAEIIAYEPVRENFELLVDNIGRNYLRDSVHLINKGVASQSGSYEIYINGQSSAKHSIIRSHDETKETREMDCIGLTDIFLENKIDHIDLLKMDVEGAEFEIFRSAKIDDLNRIYGLVIEYHEYIETVDGLISFLENNGFKLINRRQGGKEYTGVLYMVNIGQNIG